MALRNLVVGTLAVLALAPHTARAMDRCTARVNPKSGAVEVNALGVGGSPTWSGSPAEAGVGFADASTCIAGARARRCHLGATGSLAAITPPVECRVCVHDGGATPCCAVLRGCTPGPRLRDASFVADDPRVCQGLGAADPACAPIGIWQQPSAPGEPRGLGSIELLELDGDGRAAVASHDDNGAVRCSRALFTKGAGDQIALDLGGRGASLFRFRRPDADTLDLSDAAATALHFVRRDAVPDDLLCRDVDSIARIDGLPRPSLFTGIAFDGTSFWYTQDDGTTVPIDEASGTAGAPIGLPGVVQAADGTTLWMTGTNDANRGEIERVRRDATVVDVVTVPGGNDAIVSGVAVDAAGHRLLLATAADGGRVHPLLSVDADAEPDVFLASVDVRQELRSLVFDGRDVWAVQDDGRLFRIDPSSGTIRETYLLPGGSVRWQAITLVRGDLTVLGTDFGGGATTGVILRIRPA